MEVCRFRLNFPTWLGLISVAISWGMGRGILLDAHKRNCVLAIMDQDGALILTRSSEVRKLG